MLKLKEDKKMSRSESEFHYSKNICCKWYDKKPVLLLVTNVDDISGLSNIMRRTKGSGTKTSVSCPDIINIYRNGIGSVDIMDQKATGYRVDHKSKYRFYVRIFFDLIYNALVNIHIIYKKHGNNNIITEFENCHDKSFDW